MLGIAVVILTYNKERHIERCIQSIKKYLDNIYIIDSYSTDNTIQICKSLNVSILQNKLPNISKDIAGINLKRKHIFMNKWIKFGGRYPLILLNLWIIMMKS